MNGDAARRYKELADRNTDAMRRLREHDRAVSEQVRKRLAEADAALLQAVARVRMSSAMVRMHWESAVEALWGERWLSSFGPEPDPMTPPAGMTMNDAEAEVARAYDALQDALAKSGMLSRRPRQD